MQVYRWLRTTAIQYLGVVGGLALWGTGVALATPTDGLHSVTEGLAIERMVEHEGLTIYPVVATRLLPSGDYLSMQSALSTGALQIQENGGGDVPSLEVVNSGRVPVLLVVGDVVQGGRQDRVIAQDVIVPPTGEPQVVAVNCVEAGRWAVQASEDGGGGASFSYGGRGEAELKGVLQKERDQQATWQAVAQLNSDKRKRLMALAALEEMPEAKTAETVDEVLVASGHGAGSSETVPAGGGSVRGQVHEPQQAYQAYSNLPQRTILGGSAVIGSSGAAYQELAPSSGTYMASIDSTEVGSRADAMVEALLPGLDDELQVVGLVAALGDKIVTAELYGDAALFEASRESILRGLALDALSDQQLSHGEPPSVALAAEFLGSALKGSVVDEQEVQGSSKIQRHTADTRAFEFHSAEGDLLHVNVYAE